MDSELRNIKQELISLSAATEIGFNCTEAVKQQIEALADQLETLTPTTEPTSQMELVQGRWRLLYSTFGLERETTLSSLTFGKLPDVKVIVTNIFQEIYTVAEQYNNLIEFTAGGSVKGITKVTGRYQIEGSKRVKIDFLAASAFPATTDLTVKAFCEALGVERSALESALDFSGWSDITYLDENLRLMRGNKQNLYVLVRADCD